MLFLKFSEYWLRIIAFSYTDLISYIVNQFFIATYYVLYTLQIKAKDLKLDTFDYFIFEMKPVNR